jgi:hypothetical protein
LLPCATPENLSRYAFFQLGQGPDLMTTTSAVDMRVVGMILLEVEVVFAALGAIEFYPHGPPTLIDAARRYARAATMARKRPS